MLSILGRPRTVVAAFMLARFGLEAPRAELKRELVNRYRTRSGRKLTHGSAETRIRRELERRSLVEREEPPSI